MSEQESSKDESKPRSVSRRVVNDVMILQLVEGAEPFETARILNDAVTLAIRDGYRKVILDHAHVRYASSQTAGAICMAYTGLKNMQGECVLTCLPRSVSEAFRMNKMDQILRIFKTLPEALEHFGVPQSDAAAPGVEG